MIAGDPNDYVSNNKTGWIEPVTKKVHYENRIKAAPTTFSFVKIPKYVKVFESTSGNDGLLIDFRDWINDVIEEIPEEFRATAKIDIESESGWEGSSSPKVHIYYYRHETDDEFAARSKQEETQKEAMRKADEDQERELYKYLKKKYEAA